MHSVLSSESDHIVTTKPATLSDELVIFNVIGDIQLLALSSECYTANNSVLTKVQYGTTSATGISDTFTGTSASVANAIIGTCIALDNTTLNSAPTVNSSGISLGIDSRGIRIPSGVIKLMVSGGSSIGLWKHYIRYEPLELGAYITSAI